VKVLKESLGAHSLFHFEGITWDEPTEGPMMKTENFSRRTQNCVCREGFGNELIQKKLKKKLYLRYEVHNEKANNSKKRPEFCVSSWL